MIKELKISILVENTARIGKHEVLGKHGFSALIEAVGENDTVKVLLDTGPSSDVLINNASVLGVNLDEVEVIVLSHGHYDHTGGLLEVLKKVGKRIPVIAHPDAFKPKFAVRPKLRYIGIPFSQSEIEKSGGVLLKTGNPVTIMNGLLSTGEVPRVTSYETPKGFWTVEDKLYVKDRVLDDQALVANVEDKGLVVITGCAHSGIINTVLYAKELMKSDKVHMVLGGFHLIGADEDRLRNSIESLLKINPEVIRPGHCTGSKALNRLMNSFAERCIPLQAGDKITVV